MSTSNVVWHVKKIKFNAIGIGKLYLLIFKIWVQNYVKVWGQNYIKIWDKDEFQFYVKV